MDPRILIMIIILLVFIGCIIGVIIFAIKKANAQTLIASDDTVEDSTQSLLPFEDIRDSMIHLGNDQYRAVLVCTSVNYN